MPDAQSTELVSRLKSRKLWIAVLTAAALALQGLYQEALYVVLAYLGVQGIADAAAALPRKDGGS